MWKKNVPNMDAILLQITPPPKDDHSDTVKRENLYSGSWDNTHVFTDMGVVLSVQNIGFLKANHILASWSAVARGSIQVGSLTELR